jgi:hypothetical protein
MSFNNFSKSNDNQLYMRGINPYLQGMSGMQTLNTRIMNQQINSQPSAKISDDKEILSHYNVIPNPGLKFNFIHKPHKLILFKHVETADNGSFNFNLNETFKDVVNIKLMKALMVTSHVEIEDVAGNHPLFYTLSITELNKNFSDNLTTHKINNCFCTLDPQNFIEKSHSKMDDLYQNTFATHEDQVFFDPPLNSLSKLTCQIFREDKNNIKDATSPTPAVIPFRIKLEFIIETKDKIRSY